MTHALKLTIAFLTIFAVLTPCVAPVLAQTTYEWTGGGADDDWSTRENWFPTTGPPIAGDTAIIPDPIGGIYTVEIADADAACEVLQLENAQCLTIKGRTLTLGSSSADTTSTIDGSLNFVKSGSNTAELVVQKWVTFEGAGTIRADYDFHNPEQATISRAANASGIKVTETVRLCGHFKLLVSVVHDSYVSATISTFGVTDSDDVMTFGAASGPFTPDLVVSTTSSDAQRTHFRAFGRNARIEFYAVKFGAKAPNWLVQSNAEFDVANEPNSTYFFEVPFDIRVEKDGLLDFHHDFSCIGTLTIQNNHASNPVIHVDQGKCVRFVPATG